MEKPIVIERFSDNGEHSHWELIKVEDHSILWSDEINEEDKTCSNCRFFKSCAYRSDYELDTCDEYES